MSATSGRLPRFTGGLPTLAATVGLLACLGAAACKQPATLSVALYPFVPDGEGLFQELETAFEDSYPGVNLELVDTIRDPISGEPAPLSESYYTGGLLLAEADVYEIDTVLLKDMVDAQRLTPFDSVTDRFIEGALAAGTVDGSIWAIPHWLCGNFLYYEVDDHEIRDAATWDSLLQVLRDDSSSLLVDLSTPTLDEWYITALAVAGAGRPEILRDLEAGPLDSEAVALLTELLNSCPEGSCRSEADHARVGYYARQFARRQARAYVGYSEMTHFALSEIIDTCEPGDSCLRPESIAVRALPPTVETANAVGWVDGLAIAAGLPDERQQMARDFIAFATSWDGYRIVLSSASSGTARYLLPATQLSGDQLASLAPLYPAFFDAYQNRLFLSGDGIDDELQAKARLLDCVLQSESSDGLAAACDQSSPGDLGGLE